jgi:S1-C subfamily serine protease/pSer/pThr/pTyr-binding forkhead associated (FHA) protein
VRSQQRHEADAGRIRIGRGKECELRPVSSEDTSVSRVHAELVLKPDGSVVVRDAQSRNGTFLNGAPVSGEQAVKRGDRIQLGPTGPDLSVTTLRRPGEEEAPPKKSEAAERAAAKMGAPRRSFGGKGATIFFSEMFEETSKKANRRVRIVIWSTVVIIAGGVGGALYYKGQLEQQLQQELDTRLAEQQALADSVQLAATAEYERLRREFEEARAGSAPAAVVESLRVALGEAEERTTQLEVSLERAQSSLAEQLAAGDSIRRAAQAEFQRLQRELRQASSGGGASVALMDSLRAAVQAAEDRAASVASQVNAVRSGNLATVAQANQSAVGLVTAYIGNELYDGSGFAITASGYFVTNRHVIQPSGRPRADSVYVTMADQRTMRRARIVQVSGQAGPDVALLQIVGHDGPYVARVDWSGQNVHQGEPAALIGFPAGFGNAVDATGVVRTSMSAGIFSKVMVDDINFDGFTIGGSSGSPIFNAGGEVVAIHRAGLAEAVGLGFAVPIPQLIPLMPADLRRELGIQ